MQQKYILRQTQAVILQSTLILSQILKSSLFLLLYKGKANTHFSNMIFDGTQILMNVSYFFHIK